jgi:hypothetical protein
MIKRTLVVSCVLALVMLAAPSRALAVGWDDLWDYLDQLSGPGPFHGKGAAAIQIACIEGGRANLLRSPSSPDGIVPCLFVDFRALSVEPKDPFDEVTAKLTDIGVSWHLQRYFEYGAGIGMARFNSKGITTTNFTLTYLRLGVKPLVLIPRWRDSKRAAAVKYFYRHTIRFGEISAADFGVVDPWREGTEVLKSNGVLVDVYQLATGR